MLRKSIENVLRAICLHKNEHRYLSPACVHDIHARCRRRCKFCESLCVCSCHSPDDE
jgi:hypothetical protein